MRIEKGNNSCSHGHYKISALFGQLKELCQTAFTSTTPFHLISYTLARTLRHRLKNFSEAFCIGFAKDMRDFHAIQEKLMGFFVNTLAIPFRFNENGDCDQRTLNDALKELADIFNSAFNTENALLPFGELLELLGIQTAPFDAMLVMQNSRVYRGGAKVEWAPLKSFTVRRKPIRYTKFPLTIFVEPSDNDLIIDVEFMDSYFKQESVDAICQGWIKLLKWIHNEVTHKNQQLKASDLFRINLFETSELSIPFSKEVNDELISSPPSNVCNSPEIGGCIIVKRFLEQVKRHRFAPAIKTPCGCANFSQLALVLFRIDIYRKWRYIYRFLTYWLNKYEFNISLALVNSYNVIA